MAEVGQRHSVGWQVNVLMGEFDANHINGKLLGLEYESRDHPGGAYLALPEGRNMKLDFLEKAVVNSVVRNVLALERAVLTAPTTESMEELLSVRAGETPSLAEHPAFGDLASTVADPLFVAILSRQSVPGEETMRANGVSVEQPGGWGNPGNWEALMAAFSRPALEWQEITVALWYADIEEARNAVPELSRRFNPVNQSTFPATWYAHDVCADSWETGTQSTPNGAVLAVSCQIEATPSSENLGAMMHSALEEGSLGFHLE